MQYNKYIGSCRILTHPDSFLIGVSSFQTGVGVMGYPHTWFDLSDKQVSNKTKQKQSKTWTSGSKGGCLNTHNHPPPPPVYAPGQKLIFIFGVYFSQPID